MVEAGDTVLVIEHNLDMIKVADYRDRLRARRRLSRVA
jgi:hypothetical protein